jgi:hypothetical protein
MPVPFGISVGDFIASVELIHDVLEALKESNGSSANFRELVCELYSLERALLAVKALESLSSPTASSLDAIKQVAAQCQVTVDTFLHKNRKFFPTLGTTGSKHKWKGVLHKIKWCIYRREEVEQFRAALGGHTSSINMLLLTEQTCVVS